MISFYKYKSIFKRFYPLIVFLLLSLRHTNAQCPDKAFIERRASYGYVSKLPIDKQIEELLSYLDKMQNCSYRNDSTHIRLVHKIGSLYHEEGDLSKAIKYYRQSINIITNNPDKKAVNLKELPQYYYYLSLDYAALNLTSENVAALDSCYTIAVRINYIDPTATAALYSRGLYFFDIGDYNQCISYMQRCELVSKDMTPEYKMAEGQYLSSSLLWQTKSLLELKNYEQAEKLLTSRIEECKKSGDINNVGTILSQMAELQIRKNNYDQAIEFYNKSLIADQQAGNNFNCKQTLKDIGNNIYFTHFKNGNKAKAYYFKALTVVNTNPKLEADDTIESLDIYRLIANIFVQKKQFGPATCYFQLAYHQIKPGLSAENILQISQEEIQRYKKIHYLTSLVIDEADAYRNQYETTKQIAILEKAIHIYKIADQFLDKIKREQDDLASKLFWRSDSRRLYENAIDACYLSRDYEDAFYFFEKSRSVLLSDQLNEQRLLGEDDIRKQSKLQKEIQVKEKELSNVDSVKYNELTKEIFTSKEELYELKEQIKQKNPLYFQSFLDTTTLKLSALNQTILKNYDALIELFDGDHSVFVQVITSHRSQLLKIDKKDFDSLSFRFTDYLSHFDLLNKSFDVFSHLSYSFYQLIFQNVNLPTGRIIVSPSGKYFPFEALVTSLQPLTYFLDDHAVSYTYSARYLLSTFATTSTDRTFLGVAPVKFSNLPELGGSDVSLNKVRNYFSNATSYIGHDASKNNFLNEFPKYKIIQLYTHAAGNEYSGEPVIYFADSTLSLSELLLEKKPATDLIVLSACETASGKLYSGEGVFSFNRSFAALGIPSSVSNLWEIDSRSTYKITEVFDKYLSQGLPLDIALQKAKKELKATSENKLPYYWAAPILVGKADAISLPKNNEWKWMTGIALIAALFLGGWMITRRNRSLTKKPLKTKSS